MFIQGFYFCFYNNSLFIFVSNMNFLNRLYTAVSRVQTRDFAVPEKVYIEHEGGQPVYYTDIENSNIDELLYGYYGEQNYIELFYTLPEIFAPINEIASRVADATWQLKRNSNDEVIYSDDSFNKLFAQPNPLQSFKDFVYQTVCYELLTGKEFWYCNVPQPFKFDYQNIIAWWNLPAQKVIIDTVKGADLYSAADITDIVQRYKIPKEDGSAGYRYFDADKVIINIRHSLGSKPFANVKAPIVGADKPIRNLIPVYEARGNIYIKRGALGLFVNRGRDVNGVDMLTDQTKLQLAKLHNKQYGITNNKEPFAFTENYMDFVRTAMSIQELQPFDETLSDAVAIYATLRVPRHLVPSKDNSTFANAASDMQSFYRDVIMPMAQRRAEIWTNGLQLYNKSRYIYPDFSHISYLQEDKKVKADVDNKNTDTWAKRWQSGVCTLNDWIVSFDGEKGTGAIYEKKIFELNAVELEQVKNIINLKTKIDAKVAPENTGTESAGNTN